MSVGINIGPIPQLEESFDLLFPLLRRWLELSKEAERGFRNPDRVDDFIEQIRLRILSSIRGERVGSTYMCKSRFTEEIRSIIREARYRRPDGTDRNSIKSLKSWFMLNFIWDFCYGHSSGHMQWISAMTPEGLENEPCYELKCIMPKREIRDWPLVWEDHGGEFYGEMGNASPYSKGRMIAVKTSPIWRRISRFKTPWTPFDWGSGMGLSGICRDEALALGVISEDNELQSSYIQFDISSRLEDSDTFSTYLEISEMG